MADLKGLTGKLDLTGDGKLGVDDAKEAASKLGIEDVDDVKELAKKAGIEDLGDVKDAAKKAAGLFGKK